VKYSPVIAVTKLRGSKQDKQHREETAGYFMLKATRMR
jgi:hypothetical protein